MSERDEENRSFKVQDRRRFSAEGELKPEFKSEEADGGAQPQPSALAEAGAPEQKRPATGGAQGQPNHTAPDEMNFTTFVVSLSTQALVLLGEMPDPASGTILTDLAAARHIIDILGILQDKTRGNLDREEESLLSSILFDLRMRYVERAHQQQA